MWECGGQMKSSVVCVDATASSANNGLGCANAYTSLGNYCPDVNLARRQMAVLLAKALGVYFH